MGSQCWGDAKGGQEVMHTGCRGVEEGDQVWCVVAGSSCKRGGGAGRGAHATRTAASLTFVGSSFDVAGQGLEVAQGQPQLLADTLSLALLVILLHALQDAAHIPFKASTQQQVSFIQNYVMHPA